MEKGHRGGGGVSQCFWEIQIEAGCSHSSEHTLYQFITFFIQPNGFGHINEKICFHDALQVEFLSPFSLPVLLSIEFEPHLFKRNKYIKRYFSLQML